MRVLFIIKYFAQGFGGVPEAARMAANFLRGLDVDVDVFDGTCLHENVGCLDLLPLASSSDCDQLYPKVAGYAAIVLIGPWQSSETIRTILRSKNKGARLLYMPKGGLCRVEFKGLKGILKRAYLAFIERQWISRATHLVFSSRLEKEYSVLPSILAKKKTSVIPDFFRPHLSEIPVKIKGTASKKIRLSFMAEIDPRKGLLELIEGLLYWLGGNAGVRDTIQVTIAGNIRKGREAYYAQTVHLVEASDLNVSFVGAVTHKERADFYAKTDIFLCTSQFESYGLTLLEAINHGCQVVSSKNMGVLEYIPDWPHIHKAENLSAPAIAQAIDRAYEYCMSEPSLASEQPGKSLIGFAKKDMDQINRLALAKWADVLGVYSHDVE